MSALTLVQTVCSRVGLPVPTTAVSSTDKQILQIVALANEEGADLTARPANGWQALQLEASFVTVAAINQGAVETIAPGFLKIVNDTIWDRTLERPVFGPANPQYWQQLRAQNFSGPWPIFRIQGGQIRFTPQPSAGDQCFFEYTSKNWCTSQDGLTSRSAFLQDTDLVLLSEEIMVLGIIWRWRAAKGIEYAEDYNKYERVVMNAMASDGGKDWIGMGDTRYDLLPGVVVPTGSWGI